MTDQRYWLMRGALCIERIERAMAKGFDTNADAEREMLHVEHMLGGERYLLDPYWCHSREEGESTIEWMKRAEAEYLAFCEEQMAGMTEEEIEELFNEFA